ncbi:DUF4406 domain-containing protein [Ochrobactrum soli]|uniref:DUF4406 domain-containing protein n=1 Tax=Ochrobactrum soli TaxID=2448455 RepID=UPI000D69F732|nr:DUF4406 domain-containing protein [[Ochrobactrum] soli]
MTDCPPVRAGERGKTIYLSGPMTGLPEFNYPAFHRVARELRASGHYVYNPAEFPFDGAMEDYPIRDAMAAHCAFLCQFADTIVLLSGWKASKGAGIELSLAHYLGLHVVEWRGAE